MLRKTVAILGGLAACHVHGFCAARDPQVVQLLLPRSRELAHSGFVVVRRSQQLVETWKLAGLPVCSPARAVVDACRAMRYADRVRALVAEGVQRDFVTTEQLESELQAGASAGSKLTRAVLAEVADGVRSVAEAHLRTVLDRGGFPLATWNSDLYDDQRQLAGPS